MKRVVIAEDDRRTRRVLQILLERLELESAAFDNAEDALEQLRREKVALVITDLRMPRMNGIEFMRAIRELDDEVPVIMLTAYGSVESAVEAMKLGAVDYLAKPFDVEALEAVIRRSLELSRHRRENRYLRERHDSAPEFADMVGSSPRMREIFDSIRRVAPTPSNVLITGETGTGKELVARAIHEQSTRAAKLFVPLNCTAIPAELLESELFGHVRGAFTGAQSDREGKFQAADGGTLFLDEIGDMEYRLQAKLLRVLQEGVIEPVGSNRTVPIDVRIIASTHRDLEAEIEAQRFREDLYYRLNVLRFELPPLRERKGDIPLLAGAFLAEFGRELGRGPLTLDAAAETWLCGYRWRGNVRELRNVMERAAVLSDAREVDVSLLQEIIPPSSNPGSDAQPDSDNLDLAKVVADAERKAILRALDVSGDNKARAASLLGIGERTLWTKLKKHRL